MSKDVRNHHPLGRITIWHVIFLAFALRLIWVLVVPVSLSGSDPFIYDQLAQQIALGKGYMWPDGRVTAYWPVGTSAIYSIVYWLFGHSLFAAGLLNVAMGTALIGATYVLARAGFDHAISLLAAFLMAIWPTWIIYTTITASEVPATLFFVAGIACALSSRRPWWLRVIISTALLVAAAYCRGNLLPFVLLVPVVVAIRERKALLFVQQGALALIVAGLLIAPWAMRNNRVIGEPVLISTNVGVNLWIGNNPMATGGFMEPPGPPPVGPNEAARDRIYGQQAKDFIIANPGRYIELCFKRLVMALDRETTGVAWNSELSDRSRLIWKVLASGYWYLVFLASLIGIALFVWRKPVEIFSPYILLPAATLAAPILVMSFDRLHFVMAPFVAMFAAYLLIGARVASNGTSPRIQADAHG